jgi:putative ABC transport system permease protein
MEKTIDINFIKLFSGYVLMLIPILVFFYYKTGLIKDTVISILRMTVQLLMVGLYLEYIFTLDNIVINIIWVIVMSVIATYTIIQRSELRLKLFFAPIFLSGIISIIVTDAYILGFIIKPDNIFKARYFIPITGMILGNTIKNVIISLNAYYNKINDEQNLYRWHIANGANKKEALLPFMQNALKVAFNPMIATTAIMGLISLPGMMTGQILGGSNPNIAVKYQILILITIFSSAVLNVVLAIIFSNKISFDKYNNLKKDIFIKK